MDLGVFEASANFAFTDGVFTLPGRGGFVTTSGVLGLAATLSLTFATGVFDLGVFNGDFFVDGDNFPIALGVLPPRSFNGDALTGLCSGTTSLDFVDTTSTRLRDNDLVEIDFACSSFSIISTQRI